MKIEDIEKLHKDLSERSGWEDELILDEYADRALEITKFLLENMDKDPWPSWAHQVTLRDVLESI